MGWLTVGGLVQHDEAGVYETFEFVLLPLDGIGMAAEPVGGLIEVYIVVCPIQSP